MSDVKSKTDLFSSRVLQFVCSAGVAICLVAIIVLIGWATRISFLTDWGLSIIPMSPSTAVIFLLYSISLFLRVRYTLKKSIFWISTGVHLIGLLCAFFFVYFFQYGIYFGRMSPVEAFCFLLSSLSFIFLKNRYLHFAFGVSVLLLAINYELILTYLLRMPILYNSILVPSSMLTCLCFFILAISQLALTWPVVKENKFLPTRSKVVIIGTFLALLISFLTLGTLIYNSYAKQLRLENEHLLSAVSDLKISQILAWRKEHLSDAETIFGNSTFFKLAQRHLKNPSDRDASRQVLDWLRGYSEHIEYRSVNLVDAKGVNLLNSLEMEMPISEKVISIIPIVMKSKHPMIVDFYRHEKDQRIYLSVLIPVYDRLTDSETIGCIVIQVDPEKYFYSYILHWPTPSKTAETLLIKRDGDDMLYLNELKFMKNSALNVRIPVTHINVLAVKAVLGQSGIVEGIDYIGKEAIGDLRKVPDSPWFLITRMTLFEVYSPMEFYLWVILGFIVALLFGSGAILAFVWRKQNITFYQDQLQSAETLMIQGEMMKNLGEGINIVRLRDNQIVFCNQKFEQMFGYGTGEMLEKDFRNFMAKNEKQDKKNQEILDSIIINNVWSGEIENVRKDGSHFWSSSCISPFEHPQFGKVFISVNTDITELINAKNAAESAAKSKTKFLDTAAHELRTPITTISLLVQIVQKQFDKGQPLDAIILSKIQDPVDRLKKLVTELLDVSRLERGIVVLQKVKSDIALLITKTLEEFRLQAPERTFKFSKPEKPIEIDIDPLRINQVLTNLFDNAIKYTDPDRPIEVKLEQMPHSVRLSVIDKGPGISKEQQSKLFTSFSRGSSDATIRAGGLGLGLSICQEIIKLHGGTIGVLTEEGHGSTFYFDLPINEK